MSKKYTTSDFIEHAKQVHGDMYDYSEVVYIHSKIKVKIFCKKCKNYFWQIPNSHLLGSGCKNCNTGEIRLTKASFIEKAKKIHDNKYNYDDLNWIDGIHKVSIKCNRCNKIFKQKPHSHLAGQGCINCANKLSLEAFIEKAIFIHGNKYDYTNSRYNGMTKPISIKCNHCNKTFTCLAISHLKGSGCSFCTKTIFHQNLSEKFIKKAKHVHKNKYSYDQVQYKNSKTPISIICNKCNKVFIQLPSHHLRGNGCPYCKQSKGELQIENWLILHNIKYITQKRFYDCKDKHPLPFDFYLPKHNICIEYQGQQHYNLSFFIGKYKKKKALATKAFKTLKLHDQIKRQYCKKMQIKLLEIRYDEKIELKLKTLL